MWRRVSRETLTEAWLYIIEVWKWLSDWHEYPARIRTTWRTGWLISASILVLALSLIWLWPKLQIPKESSANALYLLSTIAQSLAAVFALVFTITLVIAQLSSAYSPRMVASFFSIPTVAYILLFIVSLFVPLWFLANPDDFGVKLSLTLAALSTLLLVPYFLSFRERSNPEWLLSKLKQDALKQLQGDPRSEPEAVVAINDYLMNALNRKDYDAFRTGIGVLTELIFEAYTWPWEERNVRWLHVRGRGPEILERLRAMCFDNLTDIRVSARIADLLGNLGREGAQRKARALVGDCIALLNEVGMTAAQKGLASTAERAVNSLGNIGVAIIGWEIMGDDVFSSPDEFLEAREKFEVIYKLQFIAVEAMEKGLDNVVDKVIQSLGRVALKFIEEDMIITEHESLRFIAEFMSLDASTLAQQKKQNIADTATEYLLEMGRCAVLKDAPSLKSMIVESIAVIERETGPKLIKSACLKINNRPSHFCLNEEERNELRREREALNEFMEFYRRTKK